MAESFSDNDPILQGLTGNKYNRERRRLFTGSASVPLNIKVDFPEAAMMRLRDICGGDSKAIQKYVLAALNKVGAKANTVVSKRLSLEMGIQPYLVKKRIWFNRASKRRGYAELKIGRNRWPLINFMPIWTKRYGVNSKIMGESKTFPSAFISTGPKVGRQVFERVKQPWESTKGKGILAWNDQKSKLRKIPGISPAQAFSRISGIVDDVSALILAEIPRQIESQINRALHGK